MKTIKTVLCFIFIALLCLNKPAVLAETVTGQQVNTANITAPKVCTDNKISTRTGVNEIKITSDLPLSHIYIVYWDTPVDFTLQSPGVEVAVKGEFLHRLIELPPELKAQKEITVKFEKTANISEISAYNNLHGNKQNWQPNNTEADLLLFSTHADDEQLFFAGTLPKYALDNETEVQVVYFTDHNNNILRRHELLDGLWAVGVRRYPVISFLPDAYSESYEGAVANLKKAGYSEEDALNFQIEQIRKFKPLVILGHDLKGEYGHGQHILNATLLTQAVIKANDSAAHPSSFELYGLWDTPKLYLHLYKENQIVLDLDTKIEGLDKTPFQISKEGFACHGTQQGTWFKTWLNGKEGEITKATQITKYAPGVFGLYRSTVGADVLKTDLFENVTKRSLIPPPEPEQPEQPETPPENNNFWHPSLVFVLIAVVLLVVLFVFKKFKTK